MSTNEAGILFYSKLNASELKQIQNAFQKAEEENQSKLVDKDTFAKILSKNLSTGSEVEYHGLFDSIDISREGQISWDRMCNHLLLEYYEKEDRIKSSEIPQWKDLKHINNPHKDFINGIMFYKTNTYQYVTVSKDGLLCIYDENFVIKRTHQIETNQEEMKLRDLWVTDSVMLLNLNKISFTTTSKEIWIYDISKKFVCQYKIQGFKYIPLCLTYWSNPDNSNQSILAIGDTNGDVYVFFFSATNSSLFDKPLKNENSQDICFVVHIDSILAGDFSSASCLLYHSHTAWVRQVHYVPSLNCFITCSTNPRDSIVLAWLGKSQRDLRLSKFEIPPGINCFDFHVKFNLIASAGIDNNIHLWNPYVISKPVGILRGHMHNVIAVQFTHSKGQLISLSKDKVLRVWDANLKICLQRLSSVFPKSIETKIFLNYDPVQCCLIASVNNQLYVLQRKSEIKDRIVSHNKAVTDCVYNPKFGQVISVSEGSGISIWLLSTGQKIKHISNSHGNNELTAVNIDHTATRILTAGTDGCIKIWDMNGICYHELIVEDGNPCEINQILCIKRMILAIGWSKMICSFSTAQLKSFQIEPTGWKGKRQHWDDILVADFIEPRTLVTASYDGDIVFWNSNTENSTRKIVSEPLAAKNRSITLPPIRSSPMPRKSRRGSRTKLRNETAVSPSLQQQHQQTDILDTQKPQIAVTSIKFLKTRNGYDPRTADLYSCHSNGTVRFWNSLTCEKINEFDCFDQLGNVTSCVDEDNRYLCVGGETGHCKIYNIKDYAVNFNNELNLDHSNQIESPEMLASFHDHADAITQIEFIEKNDLLFILISSMDQSISLHCFGFLVGVFGQKQHWNILDKDVKKHGENSLLKLTVNEKDDDDQNDDVTIKQQGSGQLQIPNNVTDGNNDVSLLVKTDETSVLTNHDTASFPSSDLGVLIRVDDHNKVLTDASPTADSHQTWDKTVLGKTYQEIRKMKRNRQQPYDLDSLSTEIPTDKYNHSYRYLKTKEMNETENMEKPDFVTHPERYFLDKTDDDFTSIVEDMPDITRQLKFSHDDKSIFPKYILDMEMKTKTSQKFTTKKTNIYARLSSQNSTRMNNSRDNNIMKPVKRWKQVSEDVSSTAIAEMDDV